MQEVEQVVGVLASGIEADHEGDTAQPLRDAFQALAQERVAGGRLGEGEFVGSRLQVVLEEGSVMAAAGGVDADGDASDRVTGPLRSGSVLW